jgi:hypothetical protein
MVPAWFNVPAWFPHGSHIHGSYLTLAVLNWVPVWPLFGPLFAADPLMAPAWAFGYYREGVGASGGAI